MFWKIRWEGRIIELSSNWGVIEQLARVTVYRCPGSVSTFRDLHEPGVYFSAGEFPTFDQRTRYDRREGHFHIDDLLQFKCSIVVREETGVVCTAGSRRKNVGPRLSRAAVSTPVSGTRLPRPGELRGHVGRGDHPDVVLVDHREVFDPVCGHHCRDLLHVQVG